jgi:hypothetical protein
MNGAESLVRTLVAGGVDVCFTNLRHRNRRVMMRLLQASRA